MSGAETMIFALQPLIPQMNSSPPSLGSDDSNKGSSTPLEGDRLIEALRRQVEFYFSKANLQSDGFLVSQMDANGCVPINVIAQFAKVRALTTDESAIKQALAESTVCTVTPQGIRSNLRAERNTIILREIPSDTASEKVHDLFVGDGMESVKNIRSDVGDTWFVTCNSEKDAMNNILALRKKTFNGKSIKARLKGENLLRSFFPVPIAPEVPNFAQLGPHVGVPYGVADSLTQLVSPSGVMGDQLSPYGYPVGGQNVMFPGGMQGGINYPQQNGSQRGGPLRQHGGGRRQPRDSTGGSGGRGKEDWAPRNGGRGGRGEGHAGRSKAKTRGDGVEGYKSSRGKKPPQSPTRNQKEKARPDLLSTANFPPLSASSGDVSEQQAMITSVVIQGYSGDFAKYKPDEILRIVQSMTIEDVATIGGDLDPVNHPLALEMKADSGLLVRQRSISIDEVREQLRRGRPVHREATLPPEAVDYKTLMFGDSGGSSSGLTVADMAITTSPLAPPVTSDQNESSVGTASLKAPPSPSLISQPAISKPVLKAKESVKKAVMPQNGTYITEKEENVVNRAPMGAYAAALMKAPGSNPPQATKKVNVSSAAKTKDMHSKNDKHDERSTKGSESLRENNELGGSNTDNIKQANGEHIQIQSLPASRPARGWEKPIVKAPVEVSQPVASQVEVDKKNEASLPHDSKTLVTSDSDDNKTSAVKVVESKVELSVSNIEVTNDECAAKWGSKRSFLDALKSPGHKEEIHKDSSINGKHTLTEKP